MQRGIYLVKKLFLGALLAPFAVLADDSVTLDPIVVTATGTPVPVSETLASTIVIDRAAIERSQADDVLDILRFEAGLDIGRTGGPGQQAAVFIRGGESNHTLVLVDGVRVNPATIGGAALQNIAPEMIERIEVVKGPRATLYGSDAIGGVINIITRRAQEPNVDVQLRAGVDDTREISAQAGYADAEKNLSLQLQQMETEGFPPCAGGTLNRGYDRTTVNLRGGTRIGGSAELGVRLWNAEGNVEYMDFCGAGNSAVDQDFQNETVAVDLKLKLADGWDSTLTLSRSEDDIQQNQANFLGNLDNARTVRPTLDWRNVVQVGKGNRFSFGLGAAREDVTALSFGTVIDETREVYSAFLQDELTLGRHILVAGVSYADYEDFGGQVNGTLEYGLRLFDSTKLIASVATGFRAPDFSDRFGFGGNPDLDPEEARNYELGLRQQLGKGHSADLRIFQSDVDDLISVECDPMFNCLAVNIDEYRNRGAELAWNYRGSQWTAGLSAILQKPEDRSTGDLLARRAKRSVTGHLVRRFGAHSLGIDVLGSGERREGAATLGGYALVNLTAGLQLDPMLRLEGRLENLLDKEYQTALGYNQQGTAFFVSLRITP